MLLPLKTDANGAINALELKAFLDNKQTKDTLLNNAQQFLQHVGKNWFGLDRVMRKSQYKTLETAKTVLDLLVMSGFAHCRVNEKNQLEWKITLSEEAKLSALKADVEAIDMQVYLLEEKRDAIVKSIRAIDPTYKTAPNVPVENFSSEPVQI